MIDRTRGVKRVALLPLTLLIIMGLCSAAHAVVSGTAVVNAPIIGDIEQLTMDCDPAATVTNWCSGKMVIGGQQIVLPRNLIIDLPANRLSLVQLFKQAPTACQASGIGGVTESGLAKADLCVVDGKAGLATVQANRYTTNGQVIAGEVRIDKGLDTVSGTVTYINRTQGYFRLNGVAGNRNAGVMIRMNDPVGRWSVQRGLGCDGVSPNCSPDVRFTGDTENYTWTFATGFPACIQNGRQSPGFRNCPTANHPAPLSGEIEFHVPDPRHFAPIVEGDYLTATGNFETVNGVRFLSAHSGEISGDLVTVDAATEPDYIRFEEVLWQLPTFPEQKQVVKLIGKTTLVDSPLDVYARHYDKAGGVHEIPVGSTINNRKTIKGGIVVPPILNKFAIIHVIDFRKFDATGSPCTNLGNAGIALCSGVGLNYEEFKVLNPVSRDIVGRSHRLFPFGRTNAQGVFIPLKSIDASGHPAPNGQYVNPVSLEFGALGEVNLNLMGAPISLDAVPWNLDRRLSPGGCDDATGAPAPCEADDPANPTKFALTPFPSPGDGFDPRFQFVTGAVGIPTPFPPTVDNDTRNRILSFFDPSFVDLKLQSVIGEPGGFDLNAAHLLVRPPEAASAATRARAVTPISLICH